MGSCGDKLKHRCSPKHNAVCVYYDGYIPDDSELKKEDCVVIEETTEDLYKITDKIKDNINLKDLGKACLKYDEEEVGKPKVREVLKKHEEQICELLGKTNNEAKDDIDIRKWGLDLKCLDDPCNNGINTLKQLLQAMINKMCECCNK